MISQDSITFVSRFIGGDIAKFKNYHERIISYLPLSHIAAQVVDVFCSMCFGSTVYFAQPDALKGSLNTTIKEVRPTFFFGVPRVWEKMQDAVEKVLGNVQGCKLSLINWARQVAALQIKANFYGQNKSSLSFSLAKKLVFDKIHRQLGLDKCRYFYSGAAPITKETLDFFISLGFPLCEVYGMR
jgi:long-chain-fatty-acid--CoA ligase ACSBG